MAGVMKKIGFVAKFGNPRALDLCAALAELVHSRGIEAYGSAELVSMVKGVKAATDDEMKQNVEAVVVLGGDGTMLYAARVLNGKKVPILGANMGGLGFLTSIRVEEIFDSVERLISGNYETEERMMLNVRIVRGINILAEHNVLNDVVIKSKQARLVKLDTSINKEYVTTFRADGIIVASPTGSTAYALSASGPILYPTIHSISIVPICPFNLTNRPVVIPDWMDVDITIKEGNPECFATIDGQIDVDITAGDRVVVKRAESNVYLVKTKGKGYFDILRERLSWEAKSK
ncbi:MAG: NAD(+)/NADH kinase [Deltaproteobacteria bacterium]|nr:NAD(+)/NADH kinase [Deltaproteobacteria bacterium]